MLWFCPIGEQLLAYVLFLFYCFSMWKTATGRKTFLFMVRVGLGKGLSMIRDMKRRSLAEERQRQATEKIVHELETSWKIEEGPPGRDRSNLAQY